MVRRETFPVAAFPERYRLLAARLQVQKAFLRYLSSSVPAVFFLLSVLVDQIRIDKAMQVLRVLHWHSSKWW